MRLFSRHFSASTSIGAAFENFTQASRSFARKSAAEKPSFAEFSVPIPPEESEDATTAGLFAFQAFSEGFSSVTSAYSSGIGVQSAS